MSYPYVIDLAFGSEKATADPATHIHDIAGGDSPAPGPEPAPALPTNNEELQALVNAGLAVNDVQSNDGVLELSGIDEGILGSLPGNLEGIVETGEFTEMEYSATGTGSDTAITLSDTTYNGKVALILKQAVDNT